MPRDYREVGRTINKDHSDGPVNTMPGDIFLSSKDHNCINHENIIAEAAIQTETDSLGCEYKFVCSSCLNNHLKSYNNEQELHCEHCEHCGLLKITKPRRDPEEGSSGRLYNICNECNKQMIDDFCDEVDYE